MPITLGFPGLPPLNATQKPTPKTGLPTRQKASPIRVPAKRHEPQPARSAQPKQDQFETITPTSLVQQRRHWFTAVKSGQIDTLKALILNGQEDKAPSNHPLHWVAGNLASVLQARPLLEQEDAEGQTALMQAAKANHLDLVRLLLAMGADPNHVDRHWQTLFYEPIAHPEEHVELLEALFEPYTQTDVNRIRISREREVPPLIYLTKVPQLVKKLLDQGADPNIQDVYARPLHKATQYNQLESARLLLEAKADPTGKNEDAGEQTPFSYALRNANAAMAELLIQHGAPLESHRENRHQLLFRLLASNKNDGIAKLLMQHGAFVDPLNPKHRMVVIQAFRRNDPELTDLLKRHGARPEWFVESQQPWFKPAKPNYKNRKPH